MNQTKIVKEIIKNNIYLTLATSDKKGRPWISPVFFAYDSNYNFYWCSEKRSRHSTLIEQNNRVAGVIFDSSVPEGEGNGVYIIGKAQEVQKKEIPHAINIIYNRKKKANPYKKFRNIHDFTGNAPWRMYKLLPQKFWTLKDSVKVNGYPVDRRTEVKLKD